MAKIGIVIDPHLAERAHRCRKDNFLEVALDKLEFVAKNNDYVIIAGDLFHIHNNSTLFFNTVHTLFNKYRGKFHAIPGNHDVFNRNLQALNRTTLGSLYYTDVLNLHLEPWELCGLTFVPCMVDTDPASLPKGDDKSIMIAHKFFNNTFTPEESLTREDVAMWDYPVIFLGHDHKPYPTEYIGETSVIRMGSLTRIDTQVYNKDRDIVYYQINTDETGEFSYELKIIPTKTTKECYVEEAYQHMCSIDVPKKQMSFANLGQALSKLTRRTGGVNSLDNTLRELKAPEKSISDIRWRHEINGIQYT